MNKSSSHFRLSTLRRTLAVLCFIGISLLFLDITGVTHAWFGWLARIQFLPAVLATELHIVALLVLATIILGRIYCSVLCPLGVLQDVIARLHRKRYSFSPERRWLRYGFLAIFLIALCFGVNIVVALLAPYSAFGRIASTLVRPLFELCNNTYWQRGAAIIATSAGTLLLIGILAWRNGRTYCNTICPVGTILSLFARHSVMRINFDADSCRKCGACTRHCKASCIDFSTLSVDASRCIVCGNCIDACKFDALKYGVAIPSTTNVGRRSFLIGATLLASATTVGAARKKIDAGVSAITGKRPLKRNTPVTPPGSLSANHLSRHCTACQLCVSACPSRVLRPSSGIATLMQPQMDYSSGFCHPDCTKCSELCPTGAIKPITTEEKALIHFGLAVCDSDNCESCGLCAGKCPVGAISMVCIDPANPKSRRVPSVDAARCTGCGACENVCPATPHAAIHVEGLEIHRTDAAPLPKANKDDSPAELHNIDCVECYSCMPCPQGVEIPAIFVFVNNNLKSDKAVFLKGMDDAISSDAQADRCVECGMCVPNCPMEIDIPKELTAIASYTRKLRNS